MRVIVFAFACAGLYRLMVHYFPLHEDEVWLGAALVGLMLAAAIRPMRKLSRIKWLGVYSLVIVGMYLIGFKLPRLFDSVMDYERASVVFVVLYTALCWFLTKRWRSILIDEG